MKTCVFAGTFDPFTTGHEYVVDKCLEIFDKVIIAVGINRAKTPFFTTEERVDGIKSVYEGNERVEVDVFSGLLVDFMKTKGAIFNVRGIRNEKDYLYETEMASYNQDFYPEITTVYIPTPKNLAFVSSSAVRQLLEHGASIDGYLPKKAKGKFNRILNQKTKN